jgi:hypothetical protein
LYTWFWLKLMLGVQVELAPRPIGFGVMSTWGSA